MAAKKIILLKLSGEAVIRNKENRISSDLIRSVARQIHQLSTQYRFGIVVGGGGFFRGSTEGKELGMLASSSHVAGMVATMLTGVVVQDIFRQEGVPSTILDAMDCPNIGRVISPQELHRALDRDEVIIFTGGLANPFFTTDTTAVVRALQIGAQELWKATKVDGIYTADPDKDPTAQRLARVSFSYIHEHKLAIMDGTAFTLAHEHTMPIRVFSLFEKDSLLKTAHDATYGTIVTVEEPA